MRHESYIKKLQRDREKTVYGTQAERVIKKFGGPKQLRMALEQVGYKISNQAISYWKRPKESHGIGGLIPHTAIKSVIEAAYLVGVHLTSKDLDPRETIDPGKLMECDEVTSVEVIKEKSMEHKRKQFHKKNGIDTKAPGSDEIDLTDIFKS